ncbi:Lrp/AsnC family transcriptional regulator [Candidatus Bathyarchaeota archaeon]|nr:Lrp/AsnC family transcriptional regulator [Candidatus Bathyarchaeota archaeon]
MTQKRDLDSEILRLLAGDSRQSYRELAKQLDISHVSVSSRVKAMEESGIIKGYTSITDPDKIGFYSLCLRISASQGGNLSKIGDRIAEHPEINVVLRTSGDCEILALAMCESRESALVLLDKINEIKDISKTESHVVLEAIKLSGRKLKP